MNDAAAKTPVHLWITGIATLLWNAMGTFDYLATRFRLESYMSQFTPEQLEHDLRISRNACEPRVG
jgi:hypothetical protein